MSITPLFTWFRTSIALTVISAVATVTGPLFSDPDAGTSVGPSVAGSESVADRVSIVQPISTSGPDTQPMGDKLRKRHLFWAEPVTAGGKNVPEVGSHEMKLLAVHGDVSVTSPDGHKEKGVSGEVVPSGATVDTAASSSAAVLMGGVNSIRLVPNSNVAVSQNVQGSVRHTMIDLKQGAVFSRVGRESGGTQDYEVRTPEGVAAARGTEFLDGLIHVMVDGTSHEIHVVFVNKGTVALSIDGKPVGELKGGSGDIAMGSMGTPKMTRDQLEKYLDQYLQEIQAFNVTTIKAIFDYEDGTATADELELIESQLYGSVPDEGVQLTQDDQLFLATVAASFQDLVPRTNSASSGGTTSEEPTSGRLNRAR